MQAARTAPPWADESTEAAALDSSAFGAGAKANAESTSAFGAASAIHATNGTALGAHSMVTTQGDNAVALGAGSIADQANTVSIGSVGSERRIVNVAAGTGATDAVNLSQLQATLATANAYTDTAVATGGTAANAYTDNREAAIRDDMEAGDAETLSAANAYTDSQIAQLVGLDAGTISDRFDNIDRRLQHQDRRIDRQGAMGSAMLNMAINAAGSQSPRGRVAVGAGFQGGEQALSIGYGRRIGQRASFSLGGAFSGSEKSAGIGFGVDL